MKYRLRRTFMTSAEVIKLTKRNNPNVCLESVPVNVQIPDDAVGVSIEPMIGMYAGVYEVMWLEKMKE